MLFVLATVFLLASFDEVSAATGSCTLACTTANPSSCVSQCSFTSQSLNVASYWNCSRSSGTGTLSALTYKKINENTGKSTFAVSGIVGSVIVHCEIVIPPGTGTGTSAGTYYPNDAIITPASACSTGQYSLSGSCVDCNGGTWSSTMSATNSSSCILCNKGTYSASAKQTLPSACVTCNAGTYSAAGASACSACSAGSWSASGAVTCTACSVGTFSSISSATSANACLKCPAGTFSSVAGISSATNCLDCPAGLWSSSTGAVACVSCGLGTWSSSTGATSSTTCTNCNAGLWSSSLGAPSSNLCIACNGGTYSGTASAQAVTVCTTCGPGSYAAVGSAACSLCNAGVYAASGSTTCSSCSAGTYSNAGSGACTNCNAGTWSASMSSSCARCNAGTFSSVSSATSANLCITCSAGLWSAASSSSCSRCNAGTYSAVAGATSSSGCVSCNAGTWSGTGSISCTLCNAGTFSSTPGAISQSSCTSCTAGTWSAAGAPSCTNCLAGTFSTITGAITASSCVACSPGSWSPDGSLACTSCSPGTFSSVTVATSSTQCLSCNAGTFSASGSSSCSFCPAGTYSGPSAASCAQCSAGTFSLVGSSVCQGCVQGSYSSQGSASCSNCLAGTFSTVIASTSSLSCVTCGPGTWSNAGQSYCLACNAGTYSTAGASCAACSAGTYSNVGASSCTSCSAGQFSSSGAAGCSICNAGTWSTLSATSCSVCNAGTYSTVGSSLCMTCSAGMYSGPSSSSCLNCLSGSYSSAGSSSCLTCNAGSYVVSSLNSCVSCNAGTWSTVGASSCQDCLAGTFSTAMSSSCTTCAPGTWAAANSGSCSSCNVGTWSSVVGASTSLVCSSCNAGLWSGSGAISCMACNAGTFSSVVGATALASCLACTAGTWSLIGSNTCSSCNAGTWSSLMMATSVASCYTCNAGTWSFAGTASCTSCVAGTLSALVGSGTPTSCNLCPGGTFSVTLGATICQSCNAGTWSTTLGASLASSCLVCNAGTWSNISGAASADQCNACSAGLWSSIAGSTSSSTCISCNAGTWSSVLASSSNLCIACNRGSWSTSIGAGDSSLCNACSAGSWSSSLGATSCIGCNSGTYSNSVGSASRTCLNCGAGSWSSVGASLCANCPAGTFSTVTAATTSTVCTNCVSGTFSPQGASTCSSSCPVGSWFNGSSCNSCNAGTWSSTAGANAISACISCSPGTASAITQATSIATCVTCIAGSWSSTGSSSCSACMAGFYSSSSSATSAASCKPCSIGTWSSAGSAACTSCGAGLWSSVVTAADSSVCNSCMTGSWSPAIGATSSSTCQSCSAGTASSVVGAQSITNCISCNAGSWAIAASSTCTACNAGSWSTISGASSIGICMNCNVGTWSSSGASSCYNCPAGYRFQNCASLLPTRASILTCVAPSPPRVGNGIACTIVVLSSSGLTLGLASDFSVSSSNVATIVPVTNDGGSTFTFTAVPTAVSSRRRAGPFSISVLMGGVAITGGTATFVVYGTPSTSSSLSCLNTASARVGTTISCTIAVSGSTGSTTAVASDFNVAATSTTSSIATADGGQTFTFSVVPSVTTSLYSVLVKTSTQTITNGLLSFSVMSAAAPTIVCPTNFMVSPTSGTSTLALAPFSFQATDVLGISSQSCNVTSPVTLSSLGTSYVQCVATNTVGLSSSCTFTISNVDTTPPTLTCPPYSTTSPLTVSPTNGNTPTAVVTWSFSAVDGSGLKSSSCSIASGSTFGLGTTTVTCTATDNANNVGSCAPFNVVVSDTTPPTITCPSNYQGSPTNGVTPTVTLSTYSPPVTATDGSGIASVSCTPAATAIAPYTFALGSTVVTCSAVDKSGLSSSCSFSVTVADTLNPVLNCPTSYAYTTQVADNRPDPLVNFASSVSASDGSGIASLKCPDSGVTRFLTGTSSTVTCSATDNTNNTATCTFVLSIVDSAPPSLTCPTSTVISPSMGVSTTSTAAFAVTAATDNSGILSQSCNATSPVTVSLGITYVGCSATDNAGKTSTCVFTISNVDTTPPTLTCPPYSTTSPLTVSPTNGNTPTAVVTWSFSAVDGSGLKSSSCSIASGSTFGLGTTTVTCTATDNANNVGSCAPFNVVVSDTTPPTITCPSNYQGSPTNGVTPTVTLSTYSPPVTATDGSGIASVSCTPAATAIAPYTFALGSTVVTCSAVDKSGLSSSCSFSVTVADTLNPVLNCPTSYAYTTQVADNRPDPLVNFASSVSASDGSGIASLKCPDSGVTRFLTGTSSTVTCSATDNANNIATCTFVLSIVDSAPPSLTCPTSTVISPSMGVSTTSTAAFAVTAATDNSGILSQSCNATSPVTVSLGITYVGCSATDNAGKTSTCVFTISNVDTTPPTLTCPPYSTTSPLTVSPTNGNTPTAVVTWSFSAVDGSGLKSSSCSIASGSTFGLGTTTVTCTATDNANNVGSCAPFNVVVSDTTPPSFTCPSNQNLRLGQLTSVSTAYEIDSTVRDESGIRSTSCIPASGSLFSSGITTVTCTAVDNALNSKSCSFFIVVSQYAAPTIACPASLQLTPTSGAPFATASFAPQASDPSGIVPIVICTPPSSSSFGLGANFVICSATNQYNLTSSCSFFVVVMDTVPPTIKCPTSLTVTAPSGQLFVSPMFNATASDGSGIQSLTCNPTSGSQFAIATTTVVACTAVDNASLQSSCSFSVIVADTIPPVITCPANVTHSLNAGASSAVVSYNAAAATDNVAVSSVVCLPSSGSSFNQGNTLVTCIARDAANNMASCSFNVLVADTTPPVISCSPNLVAFTTLNAPTGVVNWSPATATVLSGTVSVSCPLFGVTTFPVGDTLISCTATSSLGTKASCSFNITIVDNQLPRISCPVSYTDSLSPGANTKLQLFTVASDDNVGIARLSCSPASGAIFAYGTTLVACMASDQAGNTAACSFSITLLDNQPPILSCPAAYIGYTSLNTDSGVVPWSAPSVSAGTAVDNVGILVILCNVSSTQNVFQLGKTIITCTAYDFSQNTASCSFSVTILDKQAPTIVCPADVDGTIPSGSSQTWLQLDFPSLLPPTDNVDVASTIKVYFQISGVNIDLNSNWRNVSLGRRIFTYSAVDSAGNSASCTFSGIVRSQDNQALDLIPPQVVCPPQLQFTYITDPDHSYAIGTWPDIPATDNVGVASSYYITNPSGLYRGAAFPVGNTSVQFIAQDLSGNVASCLFYIVVLDRQAPRIVCPATFSVYCDPPLNHANVTWQIPTFFDNVGLLSTTISRGPGDYAAGTYQVDASAVDLSGNTANCSFSFTVVTFTMPPSVSCPSSQTVFTDAAKSFAVVTWSSPRITSQTGIASAIYTPSEYYPPAKFPLGTTNVKYTVTDLYLNVQVCSFRITVLDKEAPSIVCPVIYPVQLPPNQATAAVNWQAPIAYDNVAVDTITVNLRAGSEFSEGIHVLSAFVNDTSGNISPICTTNFTVLSTPSTTASTNVVAAASASSATTTIAGVIAAVGVILLVLLIVLLLRRRRHPVEPSARRLTDEEILASAQAITLGLHTSKDRVIEEPSLAWLSSPDLAFESPPGSSALIVQAMLASRRELERDAITLTAVIGRGEFGEVHSGKIKKVNESEALIAAKTLKPGSKESAKTKFLEEAFTMSQFKHPKIVAMIGVVTKTEPALIVLEYMEMGSLLGYLQNSLVKNRLADSELTRFACQISSAMHYLGEKGVVHRDLAARNILVNKNFVCKVADFGLSRNVNDANGCKDDKIPVRWTAPEAITRRVYSTASDVWSFGIVLHEIWTYGELPYGNWSNDRIIKEVADGYRLARPRKCNAGVYSLMLECWYESPSERATFQVLFQRLFNLHKVNIRHEGNEGLYQEPAKTIEPSDDAQYLYADPAGGNDQYLGAKKAPAMSGNQGNDQYLYSEPPSGNDQYLTPTDSFPVARNQSDEPAAPSNQTATDQDLHAQAPKQAWAAVSAAESFGFDDEPSLAYSKLSPANVEEPRDASYAHLSPQSGDSSASGVYHTLNTDHTLYDEIADKSHGPNHAQVHVPDEPNMNNASTSRGPATASQAYESVPTAKNATEQDDSFALTLDVLLNSAKEEADNGGYLDMDPEEH